MDITKQLKSLKDVEYASFQRGLIPGIPPEKVLGVRMPILRKLAKEYLKSEEVYLFLNTLPHQYYDEDVFHSCLLSLGIDFNKTVILIDQFLPYIDNWAVCDCLTPKVFKENTSELLIKIKEWIKSDKTYTIRFGIKMLMTYYLDDKFKEEYLELVSNIKTEEYYVKMMIAWFFATSLSKHFEETLKVLTTYKLDQWIHNKTIQKAVESYRITDEQKERLKKLRIKG